MVEINNNKSQQEQLKEQIKTKQTEIVALRLQHAEFDSKTSKLNETIQKLTKDLELLNAQKNKINKGDPELKAKYEKVLKDNEVLTTSVEDLRQEMIRLKEERD